MPPPAAPTRLRQAGLIGSRLGALPDPSGWLRLPPRVVAAAVAVSAGAALGLAWLPLWPEPVAASGATAALVIRTATVFSVLVVALAASRAALPRTVGLFITLLPVLYLGQKYTSAAFFDTIYVTPVTVLLVVLVARFAPALVRRRWDRIDALVAAWTLLSGLTIAWAHNRGLAVIGYTQTIFEPALAYALVRAAVAEDGGLMTLIGAVRLSLLVMLGLMAVQVVQAHGPINAILDTAHRQGHALSGGYVEPSEAAHTILKLLPWYAAVAITLRSRWDMALSIFLAVVVVALLTRLATAILVVELVVLALLLFRVVPRPLWQRFFAAAAIATAASLLVLTPLYIQRSTGAAFGRAPESDTSIAGGAPLEHNTLIYAARVLNADQVLRAHPEGVGGFNAPFVGVSRNYRPAVDQPIPNFESSIPFETLAIHYGPWSAALLLLLLALLGWRLLARWRAGSELGRSLAAGLLVVVGAGILTGSLTPAVSVSLSWLPTFLRTGHVNPGETLFNGVAIWSLVVVALAARVAAEPVGEPNSTS